MPATASITIFPLNKELRVRFSGETVVLSEPLQARIERYWEELIGSGKKFTRGEVFTVTRKEETEQAIEVLVEKTDYAHYLYTQNVGGIGEEAVRVIHTSALVVTADNRLILGEMGKHTSKPGGLHFSSGGIDLQDLSGELFDLEGNMRKELQEELGIDVTDTQQVSRFEPAYFKEGGPTGKMTVIYRVHIQDSAELFLRKYLQFAEQVTARGELPELEKIAALPINSESIQRFLNEYGEQCDEYMPPLLEKLVAQVNV